MKSIKFIAGLLLAVSSAIFLITCSGGGGNGSSTHDNGTQKGSFNITPLSGTTSTNFSFDAAGAADNQGLISISQVRWDWENDGTFDTDWTSRTIAFHQYSTTGLKTVGLEIKDTAGMTHFISQIICVYTGCGTITDWDGNTYETVKIGNQCWMAENFKGTHYRNGYPIPNVINNHDWSFLIETRTGAYCNYDNDDNENVIIYGRLYNWYAASSPSLPPEGWHLPTHKDWKTLIEYVGGEDWGGIKLREQSCLHWDCNGSIGTNESGFSALPGGYRDAWSETVIHQCRDLGIYAKFWSSTETFANEEYSADNARIYSWRVDCVNSYKNDGLSIRFVRD